LTITIPPVLDIEILYTTGRRHSMNISPDEACGGKLSALSLIFSPAAGLSADKTCLARRRLIIIIIRKYRYIYIITVFALPTRVILHFLKITFI
ncbi:MAG: hypothetical protein ACOYJ0_07765, partial [Eubacterium sp.]